MRTVGSEEDLQLDGLVHMETGRLEPGLTLDCSQKKKWAEQISASLVPNKTCVF